MFYSLIFSNKKKNIKILGSAGSLRTSSCSKISNSEGSLDSNQNAERDKESLFISNTKESDIEILSNPSQSSIEVLDR